jgi:integrase
MEVIRKWRQSGSYRKLSASTQKMYELAIKRGYHGLMSCVFRDINQSDYAKACVRMEDTPSMLAIHRTAHNSIQNYALRAGFINNKLPFPYSIKQDPKSAAWDREKLEAELKDLSCPVRWVMFIGYHTAQRIGDILNMKWGDYDGTYITLTQQKTHVKVRIPVTEALKSELDFRRSGTHTDYIVEHYNEVYKVWQRMDYTWFWPQYRALYPVSKFPPFHGIRHTAATKLAALGASPHTIQAITGHRSLASVQRYTQEARMLIDSTEIMKRF